MILTIYRCHTKVVKLVNQSYGVHNIMPLVITSLRGEHTDTQTHTDTYTHLWTIEGHKHFIKTAEY